MKKVILYMSILLFIGCGSDRAATDVATKLQEEGVLGVVESDRDGDGISDFDEVNIYGTNPDSNDTDGDGIIDGNEISLYLTDPIKADSDGDGLDDWLEIFTYDTNATKKDSDEDGLEDGVEIFTYDTNATNKDSDGDGLDDGAEILTYGTNATNKDSDGDGLDDGVEILTYDTNATNKDTDSDGLDDKAEIFTYNTNATNSDSDGDCLLDSFEILNYETNATNKDTDGDNVDDGIEIYSYVVGVFDTRCILEPETLEGGANPNPAKDGIPDMERDIINALDPTNDSDGDGQSNVMEQNCTEGDPLDSNKLCPSITETTKGATLLAYGYAYVPGGFDVDGDGINEGGFWMSRYQARSSGVEISSETVIDTVGNINQYMSSNFKVLNRNVQVLDYNEAELTETQATAGTELLFKETDVAGLNRISNMTPYLAQVCLSKYALEDSNGDKLDIEIKMPTMKQYLQVKKLLDADYVNNGDGRHIRNGLLGTDPNVPLDTYSLVIDEFGESHKEFVRNLVQLRDFNGNDTFSFDKDVPDWWDADETKFKEFDSGATSGTDIGQGTGPEADAYAVVVRGGEILDVRISLTGTESDSASETNGISFRAATDYIY